jgi:hypothetical protein
MKALERLRALDNSQHAQRDALTKPTEPPFGGFVSTPPGIVEKITETLASNDTSPATPEQAAELRTLFAIVAADWPDVEQAEALALALSDSKAALTCFRELARKFRRRVRVRAPAREVGPYTAAPLAERDPDDNRRTCRDCANLASQGRCLSAWRREGPAGATREYHPIADLLRRCESYVPGAVDPDRRPSTERWPNLRIATP